MDLDLEWSLSFSCVVFEGMMESDWWLYLFLFVNFICFYFINFFVSIFDFCCPVVMNLGQAFTRFL